jgi:Uma2 family endonuclease
MNDNLAYQEDLREEMIDGKVVLMSPRPNYNHNRIAANIYVLFESYLRGKQCTAFSDGYDLYLSETERFVPDMMIVCDRNKIKWNGVHGAPDLVVEVLSPGTAKYDRGHKKDVYGRCGVREYWIVSPKERSVEVYCLSGTELVLSSIYTLPYDYELEDMTEQDRADFPASFRCSLYDDFDIQLEDIFHNLL